MELKNNVWSALLFTVVLLFFAHQFWSNHQERKASLSWPTVSGKVIAAHLREIQHTRDDDNKTIFHNSTYTRYQVNISYEYTVDERTFTGDRIEVSGPTYSTEREALKALSQYKEGQKVQVYYNPKNPKASLLTPG